eukprot:TRINITY_DN1617_c0_g1_i1.p4 TRINITY_DN1617_c0_g1~~TRINITY_DN1617_c0_g1_i1.p4  ORF type:complete len:148 (-),score=74.46 TRINITY_DN1617_c0_g1_i1:360-803(-)
MSLLKFVKEVSVKLGPQHPRSKTARAFWTTFASPRAREENPKCKLELQLVPGNAPPSIFVAFTNGVEMHVPSDYSLTQIIDDVRQVQHSIDWAAITKEIDATVDDDLGVMLPTPAAYGTQQPTAAAAKGAAAAKKDDKKPAADKKKK